MGEKMKDTSSKFRNENKDLIIYSVDTKSITKEHYVNKDGMINSLKDKTTKIDSRRTSTNLPNKENEPIILKFPTKKIQNQIVSLVILIIFKKYYSYIQLENKGEQTI